MKDRSQAEPGSGVKTHGRILIASSSLWARSPLPARWAGITPANWPPWKTRWFTNSLPSATIRPGKSPIGATNRFGRWARPHGVGGDAHRGARLNRPRTPHRPGGSPGCVPNVFTRRSFIPGRSSANADGNSIRATYGTPVGGHYLRLRELTGEAIRANDVRLSDLRLDPASDRPLMALTIPVEAAGAIVLDIDPQRFLYPYLLTWPGHSQTGETLLVRREGDYALYLSELRHRPEKPLHFRRQSEWDRLAARFRAGCRAAGSRTGLSRQSDPGHRPSCPRCALGPHRQARCLGSGRSGTAAGLGDGRDHGAHRDDQYRGRGTGVAESKRAQPPGTCLAWFNAIANDTPSLPLDGRSAGREFVHHQPAVREVSGDGRDAPCRRLGSKPSIRKMRRGLAGDFWNACETRSAYTHEFRLRRYDGEYRLVMSKGVPRYSAQGVFLGFAGSVLDITGRRRAEQKLREANANLAAELAESTRKEEEIQDLSARLIDAQEEERKRLARELHDDLSQQIAALSIATGNLKRQIPEERTEARAQSDRIHEKLVQLAEAVRRMSHELHPAILQYSGLAAALRSYRQEFGALTGIQVSLEIEGSFENVTPAAALCLFRVTQEALRNVARHAARIYRVGDIAAGRRPCWSRTSSTPASAWPRVLREQAWDCSTSRNGPAWSTARWRSAASRAKAPSSWCRFRMKAAFETQTSATSARRSYLSLRSRLDPGRKILRDVEMLELGPRSILPPHVSHPDSRRGTRRRS